MDLLDRMGFTSAPPRRQETVPEPPLVRHDTDERDERWATAWEGKPSPTLDDVCEALRDVEQAVHRARRTVRWYALAIIGLMICAALLR